MTTAILMIMLVYAAFAVAPWVGFLNHDTSHTIDAMAGGEGID